MPATGDILQVTFDFDFGSFDAQIVQMFEYTDTGTAGLAPEIQVAESLHNYFIASVMPSWLSSFATFRATHIENLTDGLGFADYEDVVNGVVGTDPLPPFVALSIRQNVSTRLTRPGFKRLPFGTEGQNVSGTVVMTPALQDALEAFFADATALDDPILSDPMCLLQPVIVGRTLNPVTEVYEIDLGRVQLVANATVQRWTSQNSRKT